MQHVQPCVSKSFSFLLQVPPSRLKGWREKLSKYWDFRKPRIRLSHSAKTWEDALDICDDSDDEVSFSDEEEYHLIERQVLVVPFSKLKDPSLQVGLRRVAWSCMLMELAGKDERCRWLTQDLLRSLDGIKIRQRTVIGTRHLLVEPGEPWLYCSRAWPVNESEVKVLLQILKGFNQVTVFGTA